MDTSTDAVQRYCMKLKKNEMRTSIKLFTTIFTLALFLLLLFCFPVMEKKMTDGSQ